MPQRSLAPCPATPNCVSTEATRESQRMAPVPFTDAPDSAFARVKAALLEESRVTIVGEDAGGSRRSASSFLFRFVDDVEFIVDAEARTSAFAPPRVWGGVTLA